MLAAIGLIAAISYNLGRIRTLEESLSHKAQRSDIFQPTQEEGIPLPSSAPRDPRVVASKASDSKLYHHSWCSGAKRIKTSNQLWFATEAEAQKAGYTLAGNCQ